MQDQFDTQFDTSDASLQCPKPACGWGRAQDGAPSAAPPTSPAALRAHFIAYARRLNQAGAVEAGR
jgi:hypothetical protein